VIVPFALVGAACLHRRWRRARRLGGSEHQTIT
jgi:hypothetical protein